MATWKNGLEKNPDTGKKWAETIAFAWFIWVKGSISRFHAISSVISFLQVTENNLFAKSIPSSAPTEFSIASSANNSYEMVFFGLFLKSFTVLVIYPGASNFKTLSFSQGEKNVRF